MSGIVIFGALAGSVTVLLTGFLAPEYFGYALAGFSVLLCIGLSGLRPVKLACAFLVLSVMVHTLKRSVFLVGEPSKGSYYALVAGPVCVAILLLFLLFTGKGRVRLPGSAFALLAYLMVAVVTTLLQSREFGAQAALFEYVVPTLLYFVGLNLPESAIGPLSRTAVRLAIASVAYGLWQFIVGPTFIDTAWAEKAQNISVQAVTVSQTLGGSAGLASRDIFRPYSLHSDPFAWALSLATMVALAGMAAPKTDSHSRWFPPSIMIALVGLPICLSRSPIFGFVAMLIFYLAVRKRYFKSPGLLVLTLAVAGIVAVSASQYVVDRFGFRESRDDTSVESRYLTVGTLSARTGSWRVPSGRVQRTSACRGWLRRIRGGCFQRRRRLRSNEYRLVAQHHRRLGVYGRRAWSDLIFRVPLSVLPGGPGHVPPQAGPRRLSCRLLVSRSSRWIRSYRLREWGGVSELRFFPSFGPRGWVGRAAGVGRHTGFRDEQKTSRYPQSENR